MKEAMRARGERDSVIGKGTGSAIGRGQGGVLWPVVTEMDILGGEEAIGRRVWWRS